MRVPEYMYHARDGGGTPSAWEEGVPVAEVCRAAA